MMDNTRRGCVTFGEVAWIQQIQQEEGLSEFQDNATIGLGTDKNGVLRRKSCYQWKFLFFTYLRLKVTCTFFVCFCPVTQKCRFGGKKLNHVVSREADWNSQWWLIDWDPPFICWLFLMQVCHYVFEPGTFPFVNVKRIVICAILQAISFQLMWPQSNAWSIVPTLLLLLNWSQTHSQGKIAVTVHSIWFDKLYL